MDKLIQSFIKIALNQLKSKIQKIRYNKEIQMITLRRKMLIAFNKIRTFKIKKIQIYLKFKDRINYKI